MSHRKLLLHRMREVLPSAGLTGLVFHALCQLNLPVRPFLWALLGMPAAGGGGSSAAAVPHHSALCAVLGRGVERAESSVQQRNLTGGFAAFIAAVEGFGPGRIFFFHLASLERIQSSKVLHL